MFALNVKFNFFAITKRYNNQLYVIKMVQNVFFYSLELIVTFEAI